MAERPLSQRNLPLLGGYCHGPLFAPLRKRRAGLRTSSLPAHMGSRRIHGMARRATERRATPPWCDRTHVRDFYRLARIYTVALGERYSAEHLVPLLNPFVCGLHVPANMSVTLLADNIRKHNNHWPDMPEVQQEMFE